ncbi:MAG: PAS domain-containing protein, partial [Spirochaetales bacterium]|nr:PAS domain-containing protein [Spirochaetales bacterium]
MNSDSDNLKEKDQLRLLKELYARIDTLRSEQPFAELDIRQFSHVGITDTKRVLEKVLGSLPVGLALVLPETGEIIYVNREFEQIYGLTHADIPSAALFFEKVLPDLDERISALARIVKTLQVGDPQKSQWDD